MTEFILLANLEDTIQEEAGGRFDNKRKDEFEEHLRKMGIDV